MIVLLVTKVQRTPTLPLDIKLEIYYFYPETVSTVRSFWLSLIDFRLYIKMNPFKRSVVSLADQQISVWIAWENRINPGGIYQSSYDSWSRMFVKFIRKDDICDVEQHDVDSFLRHVSATQNGQHALNTAKKAVNSVRRFYTARGKKMLNNKSSCYNS